MTYRLHGYFSLSCCIKCATVVDPIKNDCASQCRLSDVESDKQQPCSCLFDRSLLICCSSSEASNPSKHQLQQLWQPTVQQQSAGLKYPTMMRASDSGNRNDKANNNSSNSNNNNNNNNSSNSSNSSNSNSNSNNNNDNNNTTANKNNNNNFNFNNDNDDSVSHYSNDGSSLYLLCFTSR